jgi:cytochrome b pre-mRNA-processing protein 3
LSFKSHYILQRLIRTWRARPAQAAYGRSRGHRGRYAHPAQLIRRNANHDQIRAHPHPRTPSIRCLSTSKPTSAEPIPTTQDTREPVTPGVPSGFPPPSTTADTAAFSLSSSALRALRNGINEPYAAYAGTDTLYAKCAEQADYSIPQAKDPNADMPKTRDGEDLGVGSGWWIKGTCRLPLTNIFSGATER